MKMLFLGGPLDGELLEVDEPIPETLCWIGDAEFDTAETYRPDVRPYFVHFVIITGEPDWIPIYSSTSDPQAFNDQLARFEFQQQVHDQTGPRPESLPAPADRTVTIEVRGVP
jgi:hypothetical protein